MSSDPRQDLGTADVIAGNPLTVPVTVQALDNPSTLAAKTAIGATTVSLNASYASGSTLQIETSGASLEDVTTTGSPTGSGPYLTTLTAGLQHAHAAGAVVYQVVPVDLTAFGDTWAATLHSGSVDAQPSYDWAIDDTDAETGDLSLSLTGDQTGDMQSSINESSWQYDIKVTGGPVDPYTPFKGAVNVYRTSTP